VTDGLIKRHKRVEYIGTLCRSLIGKEGRVVNPGDANGWVHVQFDGYDFPSKCAQSSLKLVS
jgi:hypothetical protein